MGAVNLRTVLGLLRPNVASLGYGLFLAINAASVWGGVFPFLPLAFQTTDVMLRFFGAESLAFTATFLASAAGTYFFPAETRHFMVKAVSVPYMRRLVPAHRGHVPARGRRGAGRRRRGAARRGVGRVLHAVAAAVRQPGRAGAAWETSSPARLGRRCCTSRCTSFRVAVTAYLIPCVFLPLFGLAVVLKSRTIDLDQPMFEDAPREHRAHLPPRAVHHLAARPCRWEPSGSAPASCAPWPSATRRWAPS